jgi:protein SERAC1
MECGWSSSLKYLVPWLTLCRAISNTNYLNHIWQINRPLVFIAHSLGGLFVKRALCLARDGERDDERNIFSSAKGLLFLGTPHRNIESASQALGFSKLFSTYGTGIESKIDQLELASTVSSIEGIQVSFEELLQKNGVQINITTFYEELPVPGIGLVIFYLHYIAFELA